MDRIGERWTILIIRELIAGPRRFTDLLGGLPGISTNLLSERLKDLEQQGMIRRRKLRPAGSAVYELTALGQALEPMLLALGRWGSQFVPASMEGVTLLHVNSYALTLKTFFRPQRAQGLNETYTLYIDDEVMQVQIAESKLLLRQGEALKADAVFLTDMPTYLGLLSGQIQVDEAVEAGLIRVEGDADTLRRFLNVCGLPSAVEKGSDVVSDTSVDNGGRD